VTRHYNLHDISIEITAPTEVADAIERRLSNFHCSWKDKADLTFTFNFGDIVPDLTAEAREIYQLEHGQVLYDPTTGTLFGHYRDSLYMKCSLPGGYTTYTLKPDDEAIRLSSHILFTLPLIESLRRRSLFNVHAAGLSQEGKAVLLAGSSGAGKSTLTLALTHAGWDFMSDDMLFLRPAPENTRGYNLLGFPEGIDYPGTSASLFQASLSLNAANGNGKHHLRPETVFRSEQVLQADPCALVFPQVANTNRSVLKPIDPSEAFMELAPNVLMSDRETCRKHFEALANLSRQVPAYRLLTGTDLSEAERMLAGLLADPS
jgi:hypothetical protein